MDPVGSSSTQDSLRNRLLPEEGGNQGRRQGSAPRPVSPKSFSEIRNSETNIFNEASRGSGSETARFLGRNLGRLTGGIAGQAGFVKAMVDVANNPSLRATVSQTPGAMWAVAVLGVASLAGGAGAGGYAGEYAAVKLESLLNNVMNNDLNDATRLDDSQKAFAAGFLLNRNNEGSEDAATEVDQDFQNLKSEESIAEAEQFFEQLRKGETPTGDLPHSNKLLTTVYHMQRALGNEQRTAELSEALSSGDSSKLNNLIGSVAHDATATLRWTEGSPEVDNDYVVETFKYLLNGVSLDSAPEAAPENEEEEIQPNEQV